MEDESFVDPPKILLRSEALHDYIIETNVYPREHEQLKKLREKTALYEPEVLFSVPPEQGQLMSILLKMMKAKKTLEVGVFTGYSLLVTALAIPKDGKDTASLAITAIDINKDAFEVGLPFIKEAGVAHKINFIESDALAALDKLVNEEANGEEEMFDFVFVDADKESYSKYHDRVSKLVKIGGVIGYDNTLWYGSIVTPTDPTLHPEIKRVVYDVIAFNKKLANDSRFEISQIPVGDGFTICRRVS